MKVTNEQGIDLALAVWVMHDEYDYIPGKKYISATGIMKPIRQIILNGRMDASDRTIDVADLIKAAMGKAFHDSIEKAWKVGYRKSLSLLGYPDKIIDRVMVNPEYADLKADTIPVYIEQRMFRELNGWTIGGKFDMVAEGRLHDNKSTSAWSWVFGSRDDEHRLQGSIYRWIDQGQLYQKITDDLMSINYIFTDWQKSQTSNEDYPQKILEKKNLVMLSSDETEDFLAKKLALIERYKDVSEERLPECTKEELWMSDPVHKYYSDPAKTSGRATKNFDNLADANAFKATKGKGVVISTESKPKRCEYCQVFDICTQKDKYFS